MGLSIYAISNIKLSGNIIDDEPTDKDINVYPGTFNRIAGLEVGLYQASNKSNEFDFHAGSYGTYNWFRRNLSTAIFGVSSEDIWLKSEAYEGRPFFELIEFSDCDGVIGPEVSKKLHEDFETHRSSMIKYCLDNFIDDDHSYEYTMGVYDNFSKAFKIASNGGLVLFT
jgi:hypothetical protein